MSKLLKIKPYFCKESVPSFSLYKGNCLNLLCSMEPNVVDMIFADPPYNLSNGGFSIHSGKRVSVNKGDWDKSSGLKKDFEFHCLWIEACRKVLKLNGTIWISGTYHSIYQCGYALQSTGFHILNDISWYKPNASPNLSCRLFTASHETLIWAKKSKDSKHTFNYKKMKQSEFPNDFLKKKDRQMRSVWAMSTSKPSEKIYGKHPTQKPLELLERIILSSTRKGATILDPFSGSGTTGIAAYKHGRKYIGFDFNQSYLKLSRQRFCAIDKDK